MAIRSSRRCTQIDAAIGQRIRTLRRVRGVTQKALGETLGVSCQQVQKYERGMNTLGPSQLVQLSTYFDVPVGRFFDGMEIDLDGGVVAKTETENDLNERVLEVAFRMNAVSDTMVRDSLLDLVGSLASALAEGFTLARRRESPPGQ